MPLGALFREYYQELAWELVDLRDRAKEGLLGDAEERRASLEKLFSDAEETTHDDTWETPHLTGDPEIDRLEREFQRGAIGADVDPWADENREADAGEHDRTPTQANR